MARRRLCKVCGKVLTEAPIGMCSQCRSLIFKREQLLKELADIENQEVVI